MHRFIRAAGGSQYSAPHRALPPQNASAGLLKEGVSLRQVTPSLLARLCAEELTARALLRATTAGVMRTKRELGIDKEEDPSPFLYGQPVLIRRAPSVRDRPGAPMETGDVLAARGPRRVGTDGLGGNGPLAVKRILRAMALQAVARWVKREAQRELVGIEEVLVAALRQAGDLSRRGALNALFAGVERPVRAAYSALGRKVEKYLRDIGRAVSAQAAQDAERVFGVRVGTPSSRMPDVEEMPVLGLTTQEHVTAQADAVLLRFKAAVRAGVAVEDSTAELIERVRGAVSGVESHIPQITAESAPLRVSVRLLDVMETAFTRFIESAVHTVAGAVEQGVFDVLGAKAAGRLGYQWLAVLDDRVCAQCEEMHGALFDADLQSIGESPDFAGPPPLHYNCRCVLVPVRLDQPGLPHDAPLEAYLSEATDAALESAFGRASAQAFRRGEISAIELIRQREHVLSPRDLASARDIWASTGDV